MTDRLLIIEDDFNLNQMLALHFEDQHFEVHSAFNCHEGKQAALQQAFDLVLLDQQLPDGNGIDLLPQLIEHNPGLPVIMMTGQHDLELAIEAIKRGAADFVHKPVKTEVLQACVEKVLRSHRSTSHVVPSQQLPVRDLIGRSDAMLEVSKQIALSATNQATVLIHGESGTGKEVVARLIHQHSGRSGPFIAVNCAAIVDNLLESELFGHEKGAFTGADKAKPGKFEQAQNGTLFLDEIAELALPLQAKLLRALQEKVIERVGGTQSIGVEVRIIAASHRDLFQQAQENAFREDLAYRLSVVNIEIPPLRERRDDIPLLAQALLERIAANNQVATQTLDSTVLDALSRYDWPGNVRELENTLTQALVLARDNAISTEHLQFRDTHSIDNTTNEHVPSEASVLRTLDEVEAEHIQKVLNHTGGHKGKSCEILGISRPALDRKIAKYALNLP